MKNPTISKKRMERPTRILEAAGRLTIRFGFDKTTMDDVAKEAGVSKGAIYLVWQGKEELIDALIEFEMKKLMLDLRSRIIADENCDSIAALYRQTLLAIQQNSLISALYTRDGKILGDFVHRQNPERYTRRLLMSKESVSVMQSAGLLRDDLPADVITYLFSLMALGFLSINSVIPLENAPPIDSTVGAIAAMVDSGLTKPGGNRGLIKDSTIQMLDLMIEQYEKRDSHEP
jgi:TetR/AcrR family acrAB operon transcriptional repressor